jgi:hypothetical protein
VSGEGGIRTPVPVRGCTPPAGAYGGGSILAEAERVGALSAAYKFPHAAYAVLTAGLNKFGDITV